MKRLLVLICVVSLVASCGWRLRGTLTLPEGLETVQVVSNNTSGDFERRLRQLLTANGVTVTNDEAQIRLQLGQLSEERRVLTTGSNTLVTEYELTSELPFAVEDSAGNVLLPEQTVTSRRSYEFDQDDVVGKSAEERLIQQEMQRDLVEQIVRQLRFMESNPEAGHDIEPEAP